ncbi:tripeptidyl peptidase precursor, partial [Metarhizium majus ARSEF 297]
MPLLVAVLAGLLSLLSGASAAANLVQHENVPQLPQGWARMDASLDPDQPFRLSIALRQPEIHRLASKFAPGSGHLSLDEVRTLRAPDPKDAAAVVDWLRENGIHDTVTKDDWIHVNTTVSNAEGLLSTQLQRYSFDGKVSMVRARQYSVPSHLSDAISFINPISNFMTPLREPTTPPPPARDARDRRAGTAACAGTVTPNCLRQLYNMHYRAPGNSSQVRLGVSGYLEEHSNHADVRDFLRREAPELPRYDFKVELVNGGTDPQNRLTAGGEAQLDLEYVMGLGFPSQVTYYATGGRGDKIGDDGKPVTGKKLDNEPYLEFIQALLDKPDDEVPHVLSVSYGDDELSVPRPYAERVCSMLGLLTKRGTSIIHSTGDGGSAGSRVGNCRTKDGTNRKVTMSTFPASCPWVTAVGATTNAPEPPSGAGFSSGGFSQYFERPEWQAAAVDKYVEEINGHLDGYYNASMRAVPDISAVGTNFRVIVGARRKRLEGTSASAPVFAAMISLINDARLRKGKPSLGWLNEILYSDKVTPLLQDITKGQSYSCKWDGVKPGGWPAKQGWDAITGLGVPNDFAKFLEVLEDV